MARIKICREEGCQDAATTDGFCRLHYLRRWKEIRSKKKRAAARRLERYIERVYREHPDDYADVIRRDLQDPDFAGDTDEGLVFDEENPLLDEESSEEDLEELIRRLKIEEGF